MVLTFTSAAAAKNVAVAARRNGEQAFTQLQKAPHPLFSKHLTTLRRARFTFKAAQIAMARFGKTPPPVAAALPSLVDQLADEVFNSVLRGDMVSAWDGLRQLFQQAISKEVTE